MNRPSYPHPIIAREGWPIIIVSLVLALISCWLLPWVSIFIWLFFIFAVQFFRDPARSAPTGDTLVLSPADGRIVCVEEAEDPYAERQALKISVFMNVFNVHSNRSPIAGTVQSVEYFAGKFFNASLDKASLENERNAMVLKTSSGHVITAVQVAGLVAKRILCYASVGQHLYGGQRYGFIRFGSRVDVYLPLGSRPMVAIGDKVKATSTILAELQAEDPVVDEPVTVVEPADATNSETNTAEPTQD